MKLHRTNMILVIREGSKSVERRVLIDDLGVLYAQRGGLFRISHFSDSVLLCEDHHGRRYNCDITDKEA